MGFITRLLGRDRTVDALRPLYAHVVTRARAPHWYVAGEVPDTVDGRFDMVAAVLALVLLRIEREPGTAEQTARLTELFVEDMDGQLRQIGIGDIVVGKHIGKMMGALGGRLGAYRDAFSEGGDIARAVRRNIYRDADPADHAVAHVAGRLRAMAVELDGLPLAAVLAGRFAA